MAFYIKNSHTTKVCIIIAVIKNFAMLSVASYYPEGRNTLLISLLEFTAHNGTANRKTILF